MSLLAELQRRNVFRVGAACAVVCLAAGTGSRHPVRQLRLAALHDDPRFIAMMTRYREFLQI